MAPARVPDVSGTLVGTAVGYADGTGDMWWRQCRYRAPLQAREIIRREVRLSISGRFAIRIESAVCRNYPFDTLLRIDGFAFNAEIICLGLQHQRVATRG
jgi:hypothetical protein